MAGEAAVLRDNATDIEEALVKVDGFSSTLKNMCNEVKFCPLLITYMDKYFPRRLACSIEVLFHEV